MIPRANITAWRAQAPWALDEQVEQDLVLSRALSEMFVRPALREMLAFRGGTALHRLFFDPPGWYSEDLDLVQVRAGPIKPVLLEVQEALDGWLGSPRSEQAADSVKLLYGFETTAQPVRRMRMKVEINTREHFAVEGFRHVSFAVRNPWYAATTPVTTYALEELMATKLRALYQRRKGRDLYDLWLALEMLAPDEERVVAGLRAYLKHGGLSVSRAQYEANMAQKLASVDFRHDVMPLLRDESGYDIDEAYRLVHERLIARIPGEPWEGLPL
ncbi:MAG: nucleotidyl transferase AbiEii/AbiGii toxin family protein [Actinomycetia bacterium]|nr:nucleotidyl transferase AbiEii/AbiGii toxin family protein [Actinomycetes bacterium]